MLIENRFLHPNRIDSFISDVTRSEILIISSIAIAALVTGTLCASGYAIPLTIGVTVLAVSVPLIFLTQFNEKAFKTALISTSILVSASVGKILPHFTNYQISVFLDLCARAEWIDAARRILFTLPVLVAGTFVFFAAATIGLATLSHRHSEKFNTLISYYKEIFHHIFYVIKNEGVTNFDLLPLLQLAYYPYVKPEKWEKFKNLFLKVFPYEYGGADIHSKIIALAVANLKENNFEDFLNFIFEEEFPNALNCTDEELDYAFNNLDNYLPILKGELKKFILEKVRKWDPDSYFSYLPQDLEHLEKNEMRSILSRFTRDYGYIYHLTAFLRLVVTSDNSRDNLEVEITKGEQILANGEQITELMVNWYDVIYQKFTSLDGQIKNLIVDKETHLSIDKRELRQITEHFNKLRQDVADLYEGNLKLNKLSLINENISKNIKKIHVQLLGSNSKKPTLTDQLQNLNSLVQSQEEEEEEEYEPLIHLATYHGFLGDDCAQIATYLGVKSSEIVENLIRQTKLNDAQKMNDFCEQIKASISFAGLDSNEDLSEEKIYQIGQKHYMARHECFNLIKLINHLSPELLHERFVEAIIKAEKKQAICVFLKDELQNQTIVVDPSDLEEVTLQPPIANSDTQSNQTALRKTLIKITRVLYRSFRVGLILVPVFLNPISAGVGFVAGSTYCVLARFGMLKRRPTVESILSFPHGFRVIRLNPLTEKALAAFVNGGLIERIGLIVCPIVFTLCIVRSPTLAFTRGFAFSRELILG